MRAVVVALALALVCGCVEKSRKVSKTDREMIGQIVGKERPKPKFPLDIRFETKVRLIGYDLSDANVEMGKAFRVTWYWQVDKALGEGWKLFTHMADSKESRINMDANRVVREIYPASAWQAGDYITDMQEMTLPKDWNADMVQIYMGFWNGPHRLHVTKGANDGDNRAMPLKLAVRKAGAPTPEDAKKRLTASRISVPLTLDGKLDEADWNSAAPTGAFVNTMSGKAGSFGVSAKVLYDADNIYVGFDVKDDLLKCSFSQADDHLWEQDTVEVMFDPDADGKNYFEIQVSPTELVFDTRYDTRRQPRPFGDLAWTSGTVGKASLDGTVNDGDADVGYSVEMAVPWAAFKAGATPSDPPKAGEVWRMNFFVMDAREKGQRAVGWSAPKIADFHTLDRFGEVVFPAAALPAVATDGPAVETPAVDGTKEGPTEAPAP